MESTSYVLSFRMVFFYLVTTGWIFYLRENSIKNIWYCTPSSAGRPGSSEVPRNPLTRWDVSSIPANEIFLTKKLNKLN